VAVGALYVCMYVCVCVCRQWWEGGVAIGKGMGMCICCRCDYMSQAGIDRSRGS
jgi:hypothetical protein